MNFFYVIVGFYYCTLVRMICSRKMNNKINHLEERSLRIVCSDKTSPFGKLLEIDLYQYTLEIYRYLRQGFPNKVKIWLLPFSVYLFQNKVLSITCVTLLSSLFQTWKIIFIITESLSYLGPKIWDLVRTELKELSSIGAFKKAIKKWKPQNCLCKITVLFYFFSDILDFFNIMF